MVIFELGVTEPSLRMEFVGVLEMLLRTIHGHVVHAYDCAFWEMFATDNSAADWNLAWQG